MALIDDVRAVGNSLATSGWRDLLLAFGLDITAADLAAELARSLPALSSARPSLPGFEDFSLAARRGIEPGVPDRSLLFHALASPAVVRKVNGQPLTKFPTPKQLETVENYIYSLNNISGTAATLRTLVQKRTGAAAPAGAQFAMVVFAQEYRNASESVHGREASMCFSRTGVCRVGNHQAQYSPDARGYLPHLPGQPDQFCVMPVRYAAYLAWRARGTNTSIGPMRPQNGDGSLNFWVPLHKLFDGPECLTGQNLTLTLTAGHVNEKLRRVHIQTGFATNVAAPDLTERPFVLRDAELAAFATDAASGIGLLAPTPHPLVQQAIYRNQRLAYQVPKKGPVLSSSLRINPVALNFRRAPEYVHARSRLNADGTVTNLNDPNISSDVAKTVAAGQYLALHHIDFTGDGWILASLNVNLSLDSLPAYSLVTAPDFFFSASQRDMMAWSADTTGSIQPAIPNILRKRIWQVVPSTLADERTAANLQLNPYGANFTADTTLPAVVSLPLTGRSAAQTPESDAFRHNGLPDAASSVYEPGWDVSRDRTGNTPHLAAYGLGSPFPEDGKLCAALSTFWPSVAPDVARVFSPNPRWPTVFPMTDEEVGIIGNLPVDGYPGPRLLEGGAQVEYVAFDYADYVQAALDGKFTLALTSRVSTEDFRRRVLRMARVYRAVGSLELDSRGQWAVLSFREISAGDSGLLLAQQSTGATLTGLVHRFQIYRHAGQVRMGAKTIVDIGPEGITTVYADDLRLLRKSAAAGWQVVNG